MRPVAACRQYATRRNAPPRAAQLRRDCCHRGDRDELVGKLRKFGPATLAVGRIRIGHFRLLDVHHMFGQGGHREPGAFRSDCERQNVPGRCHEHGQYELHGGLGGVTIAADPVARSKARSMARLERS